MEKQVRRKEEIPGVDEQQDGERRTETAPIHEPVCMRTAACSITYLFGGEFDQGSLVALKGAKRKRQK